MRENLLEHINDPNALRKLERNLLPQVCQELRGYIIDMVSTHGGHLGASLGVVELTVALHYIFDTPMDMLVWDVGHQAYGHKILTGRRNQFATNRQLGGISGFPSRSESVYDPFGTGHSSTSISAVMGMAIASRLRNINRKHIAVIGDASIASGMAFEALNHAGGSGEDVLIILNDNAIGIDPSVGALKQYLTGVKGHDAQICDNLFESLLFSYSGPIDGHDLTTLLQELEQQRQRSGPRILHIKTTKGKGLKQAEEDQVTYHAPGKFNKVTGERLKEPEPEGPKFQDVFGLTLLELARKNEKIVGITPAMPTGSSLKFMMQELPDRAIDVGIAEQHAVTLAAGMACEGIIPYCTIYSTFLQRAYDQVIHDVALQNLPVVFCLDRAGIVGNDGPTHHGVFDLAYLNCIPNMIIAAPMNALELRQLLYTAQLAPQGPMAIRYPRGYCYLKDWHVPFQAIAVGSARYLTKGLKVAVLSIGSIGAMVQKLLSQEEWNISHIDIRFLKPLDINLLKTVFKLYTTIITIEDGSIIGGLGSTLSSLAHQYHYKGNVINLGIPDRFIPHGSTVALHKIAQIDSASLKQVILNAIND